MIIVINDNFNTKEKLEFTQQQNSGACVFMETTTPNILNLDYYYPHTQSPLCLHGTIAAGYVYFNNNLGQYNVKAITKQGQSIEIIKDASGIFLITEEQYVHQVNISIEMIQKFLNIKKSNIIGNINIVSVGSPKLLIEVNSQDNLNKLCPNLNLIYQWSNKHKISGCYVYFKKDNKNIIGRNFNHLNTLYEDGATGVAAGALTILYKKDLTIHQGHNLNNPCVIYTKYSLNKVLVGGSVTECK